TAFFFRLDGGVAGSAIAVIAVVAVGSFLGVRSGQWADGGPGASTDVSLSVRDGAREVRGDRPLLFTTPRRLPAQAVGAALHIQPAAQGSLAGSRDGRRFTWQPSPP